MLIVSGSKCSKLRRKGGRHSIAIAGAELGVMLCSRPTPAADNRPTVPMLHVPLTVGRPAMNGKLTESCWKEAARTGPLKVTVGQPGRSSTEAFILGDAEALYVGLQCAGKLAETGGATASEPENAKEFADLLIDSERGSQLLLSDSDYAGRRRPSDLLLQ